MSGVILLVTISAVMASCATKTNAGLLAAGDCLAAGALDPIRKDPAGRGLEVDASSQVALADCDDARYLVTGPPRGPVDLRPEPDGRLADADQRFADAARTCLAFHRAGRVPRAQSLDTMTPVVLWPGRRVICLVDLEAEVPDPGEAG